MESTPGTDSTESKRLDPALTAKFLESHSNAVAHSSTLLCCVAPSCECV